MYKQMATGGVTLQDIATACNVSVATVSRVLRDPPTHCSKATSARVRAAADAMGYNPALFHAARRLSLRGHGKKSLNHLIALIFPEGFNYAWYFNTILNGLMEVLTEEGFGLLTIETTHSATDEMPPSLFRGDVDGIFVSTKSQRFQPMLNTLRESSGFAERPVVFLMDELAGCSSVRADKTAGARAALGYLLDLGHRHIAYLHQRDGFDQVVRPIEEHYLGYVQACKERGLVPEEHLYGADIGVDLWRYAFDTHHFPKLLSVEAICASATAVPLLHELRIHPITAIMAPNDSSALIIYHLLRQHEIRIPTDISLIGFDDTIPLLNKQREEILSNVRVPLFDIGRTAARLMLDQISGNVTGRCVEILPTTFIDRATTALPRSNVE